MSWRLQEAEQSFSELVRCALEEGPQVDRTGVRCHPDRIRRQTSVHRSVIRTGRTCTKVRAKDRPHARGATLLPVARYGHTRQVRVAPPLTDGDTAS